MTTGAWIDNVRTDVKHAARSLRRSPGFAAVAILALAIGIGGNTAIFSVIDATRTQAIPYRDPQQLMYLIGTVRRATSGSDSGYGCRRVAMNVTECASRAHGVASATSNPELSSSWRNSAYR